MISVFYLDLLNCRFAPWHDLVVGNVNFSCRFVVDLGLCFED